MKKRKRKKRPPEPDQLPGPVKYRPPQGKSAQRPLERLRRGQSPFEAMDQPKRPKR